MALKNIYYTYRINLQYFSVKNMQENDSLFVYISVSSDYLKSEQ